ncbi:TPA: glucosyltransferase domain-containing protein, partial [Salmonella enterica subsp. enterica serovar Schwarzengrund]
MTFNNNDKMFVSILLGLVLIYTFPLLTQQSYYIDDLGRSLYGGLGWSGNGRPLADVIFYVINFGIPITDSSPLPLILGLTALVISLVYIRDYLFGNDYITAALCFMMIIANPFFIENLSYKYDSLTMCLSVAISIMASRKSYSREISNIIIAITLTIAYLSLYQASLNIYSIFLFTFILSDLTSGEDLKSIVYKAILSLFCLITGYLIYSFFIAKKLVTGGYNIEHSKIIELNSNIIESLYNNIVSFYKMISVIFDGAYSLVYYSMLVVLVVSFLIIVLRILLSEQNKAMRITLLAVSLLASLFFIIGPMLLLNSPIYAARVLIGMGGFMFFCCYSMYSAFGDKKLIFRIYFSFV